MYIRQRFSFTFCAIIFPFFIVTAISVYLLTQRGFVLNRTTSPVLFSLILFSLCIVLGYISSLFMMKSVFAPLEELSSASKEVAKGNYSIELSYNGHVEELENAINNFNFMLRELNSVEMMRNDFIANVSHEFKTPLSSISGYVTLLQDPELSEVERQEYIRLAFFNIEKLNDLTSNILQLSKLENQNMLIPASTYRLDEQIREAIVMLEPKWSAKNIFLDIDLEEITYTGQQALLFQVWSNLLGNAIKFSNTGGKISIHLNQNETEIKFLITDEGIGMSEDTLAHLFEKFYQGDSSRKEQGNGLGLALCKNILDKCEGRIYVTSTLGCGSTFMVIL